MATTRRRTRTASAQEQAIQAVKALTGRNREMISLMILVLLEKMNGQCNHKQKEG